MLTSKSPAVLPLLALLALASFLSQGLRSLNPQGEFAVERRVHLQEVLARELAGQVRHAGRLTPEIAQRASDNTAILHHQAHHVLNE